MVKLSDTDLLDKDRSQEMVSQAKKISIVIPVYNAEQYLSQSVDSARAQTYENLEILLIDDGSIDDSPKICDEYAEQDERVVVIHTPNQGPSKARNAGIKKATGEYLMFLDADDYISPETVESLLYPMENCKVDLAICGYERFKGTQTIMKRQLGKYSISLVQSRQELAHLYLERNTNLFGVAVWGKLYRKSLLDAHGIYFPEDVNYEEDCCFNLQYFRVIEKAAFVKRIYYHYRLQEESLSKGYKSDAWFQLIAGYKKREAFIKELDIENGLKRLKVVFTHVIYSSCLKIKNSDLSKKEKLVCYREIIDTPEVQEIAQADLGISSKLRKTQLSFIRKRSAKGVSLLMDAVVVRGAMKKKINRLRKG